jgi:transposase
MPRPRVVKEPKYGHRLAPDLLQRVLIRIEGGYSQRRIHKETGVSRTTLRAIERSIEAFGEPYPPDELCLTRGLEPHLLRIHKDALHEFVATQKTSYLDEMRDFLYDEYYVKTSVLTVWRELDKNGITYKVTERAARERSEPVRH